MHRPISKPDQPSKFDLSAIRAQERSGEKVQNKLFKKLFWNIQKKRFFFYEGYSNT